MDDRTGSFSDAKPDGTENPGAEIRRLERNVDWSDIVLPCKQFDTLKTIAAEVRRRTGKSGGWVSREQGERGAGISALFSGAHGTGKSLATEILGTSLGLDVYRVDLSAVVNRYIGETEKNLGRVFKAAEVEGAILLFDEADALFGKRSAVEGGHDRYANLEIGHLRERIETHAGLTILVTNSIHDIDESLVRRMQYIIEFPFPDAEQRAKIWEKIFPDVPSFSGLDRNRLAQMKITGGSISNIAHHAALLVADESRKPDMGHILEAAHVE